MTEPNTQAIEAAILNQVDAGAAGATICPSDVARNLWAATEWRDHMDTVRAAAARLAEAGEIVATQHGTVVDVRSARGPIRLGRPVDTVSDNG